MKTELEEKDIEAIAERVIKKLLPELKSFIDNNTDDEFLTIDEASKLLRVSTNQIYQWTSQTKHDLNNIPYVKRGKRLLFPRKKLIHWLESR